MANKFLLLQRNVTMVIVFLSDKSEVYWDILYMLKENFLNLVYKKNVCWKLEFDLKNVVATLYCLCLNIF